MSMTTVTIERSRPHTLARVADFVELCKPRISVLVLVSVAVAYCMASWGQPHPWVMFHVIVGTLLIAASASALNQWLERNLDRLMDRTADRPIPSQRVSSAEAIVFGAVTFVSGIAYLVWMVGVAPALWAIATWVMYVVVYTPLKTRTPANTAVGAVAGALPILIGWSAAQRSYDLRAVALFLLVFLWQFPHFMAIAWLYRDDYARAGMKMLPVVEPTGARAGIQAVWAALALLPVSVVVAVYAPGLGASVYAIIALVLGIAQLALAIQFCAWRTQVSARNLLRASLVYLPTVLVILTMVPWA